MAACRPQKLKLLPKMTTATIKLPKKVVPVFSSPRGSVQYRALYGGRGSGKSYTAALMAAIWGYAEPMRILCTREFQASIKESFHAELKAAINNHPFLSAHYDVGVDYLRGRNGTEFIFRGLRHNIGSIKSLAKIDLTICEEAEDIPEDSWLALEATVFRQPKSELWCVWNPRTENSAVDKRFIKNPPNNILICNLNWNDNPFFPPGLNALRLREQGRLDPSTYSHVWEGSYLTNSDSQVFANKWRIEEFESLPSWQGPYYGIDFGFAQDPTTCIRCWIYEDILYIDYDASKIGLELDSTAAYLTQRIPMLEQHVSRADCARPESISYLKRHGLPRVTGVTKGPGSVMDGVSFIKSFKTVMIHPRCVETIKEFRLYRYKVDKNTNDIMPIIVDEHNHCIDALRYALQPVIRSRAMPRVKFQM